MYRRVEERDRGKKTIKLDAFRFSSSNCTESLLPWRTWILNRASYTTGIENKKFKKDTKDRLIEAQRLIIEPRKCNCESFNLVDDWRIKRVFLVNKEWSIDEYTRKS